LARMYAWALPVVCKAVETVEIIADKSGGPAPARGAIALRLAWHQGWQT